MSDSSLANTERSRLFCKYLRENELLSKTISAWLSGAQMASIHEIKKCQKISWQCLFKPLKPASAKLKCVFLSIRILIPYKVLVDTEMYNNGDVGDEGEDLGNGVHLHILNRKEFPYK